MVGEPIGRYIRRLRLEYSLYQLFLTRETIVQIALQAGYQSHEAFTRAFEKEFGVAPSAIRGKRPRVVQPGLDAMPVAESLMALREKIPAISFCERHLSRRSVVFWSHFGPYADVPACWKQFAAELTTSGSLPRDAEAIGILYDDPIRCANVRYDACISCQGGLRLYKGLGLQVLPEVSCVCTFYHGEHPLSFCTCVRLINRWMVGDDRRQPSLPCYHFYDQIPFAGGTDEVRCEVCVELKGADSL